MPISEDQFKMIADKLRVEVAAIKAVAEVESSGSGFLPSGEPVILFEPHVFWKQLKGLGLNPNDYTKGNEDILYPVWGSKPYGKSSQQHDRLNRACKINRPAALMSASWGRFQLMGYHYKACSYPNIQEFINAMYRSEDDHLLAFGNYILNAHLDDELRNHSWAQFAYYYNGAGYKRNFYDEKLSKAFLKFKNG